MSRDETQVQALHLVHVLGQGGSGARLSSSMGLRLNTSKSEDSQSTLFTKNGSSRDQIQNI